MAMPWTAGPQCSALAEQCRYCTRPVLVLSTGGPDVCCLCEVHGVPPNVFMGMRKPWDFHTARRTVPEVVFHA